MLKDDPDRILGDVTSVAIIFGTFADYLPTAAALVSLLWGLIRLYETETEQKLLGLKKDKSNDS